MISRRRVLQILVTSAAVLPLAGCGWNDSDWRQKLIVVVDTPSGSVIGSAVTAVEWSENRIFKDGARWHVRVQGEAVVVELGSGRYLFALLTMPDGESDGFGRIGLRNLGLTANDGNAFRKYDKPIIIAPALYPMLVTFTNINDPASVIEVKPDELEKHFGTGVSLKAMTLEITDEPVTEGVVEEVLSWIKTHKGRIRSPDLRLGKGSHNAADVLPVERIQKDNFVEEQK